jgi:gamma-glutamyltranspeptidase
MTEADLAAHGCEWVEPVSKDFGGVTVHEIPPNGQGISALMALGMLEHLDVGRYDGGLRRALAPADRGDAAGVCRCLCPTWPIRRT